ncbi:hypothetical protein JKA74_11135 [Marivirga sp. S37H4]|uniref:Uncharacterized protein n=1 Tax=Marivirga aurantiaca TaxID=2802615 RepID=A0A934WZ72_9BACT|nr:hypothetical protein [Marivirga aurantiaca]MBK6265592.1 hypothetical protein [Marivirga aurantiaca]
MTNKIRTNKKTAMALSGILVAFLLFFQQPYTSQTSTEDGHSNPKTEKKEDASQEQAEYQIMSYQVLLPVLQFNLFHSFDLLIEIPKVEKVNFSESHSGDKVFHNFFETLFRQIISPNAP